MYFSILSKDLKRKKTMNIILLIFIILAATFISSSMNNLIVITKAMDNYFEKAGLGDFIILTINEEDNDRAITEFLNEHNQVNSWIRDENIFLTRENFKLADDKEFTLSSVAFVSSYRIKQQKFFGSNNKEITKIEDGQIYLPLKLMEQNNLKSGDSITIINGDVSLDFTILGNCKDCLLGSTMMGSDRLIISDHDYEKLKADQGTSFGSIYSVKTNNLKELEKSFNQMGVNVLVSCDKSLISMTYIMDMIMAAMLLVVSVCLILISFVILRFTIVFTLNEEFRQIGIMKAIGINNRKIRGLYITKYFAISVVGAVLGFLLSIPFGGMFLKQVSRNIILSNTGSALFINLLCSALIVVIVLLFCYLCTRQVNKYSPIDAIKNGSNGERYKRKGFLRLSTGRIPAFFFLALNDILSGLKRFSALIITFTLGILLIILPVNTINTLRSDSMVKLFGMTVSDVYMVNENNLSNFRQKGRDYVMEYLKAMESDFAAKGMPATVTCETMFNYKITYQDSTFISLAEQGTNITADQYDYTRGQAPKFANEVALTHITAESIGADIGDTVTIKIGGTEQEFVVTAIFQTMNNLGKGIRFSEKAVLDYAEAIGTSAVQVTYLDQPTLQDKEKRMEDIVKLFPEYKVYNAKDYISREMGNVAGQLEGIKQIIVAVIIIINLLVAVLMEKIFITKEKGEIGMLKSIGFSNAAIVMWQASRIGIILFISTLLGALLSKPLALISTAKCFEMMGADHIDFVIKPFEVYFMYPVIIFSTTVIASVLTALQTRKITAQETNNIE
ncbi:MAG TPA: FtsX-like permease family protein [Mobilitalea sp.]|nr:FtsX-like permease family protein [Mobilitalea sp.]